MTIPLIRKTTARYARKNDAVLDAAAALFNEHGLKGVTLADVAARVCLNTTSVTYYFRRKEDLAAACLLRSIEVIGALASAAQRHDALQQRIASFVHGYVGVLAEIADRRRPELMGFQDVRALTGPGAAVVFSAYEDLFRRVRGVLRGPTGRALSRREENTRAFLLLALTTEIQTWLGRYEPDDYERLATRVVEVLLRGIRGGESRWQPVALDVSDHPVSPDPAGAAREAFLQAATELVNEQGYHGASVEKISARLNVTKGSFYHHNDSKDDLLTSCFERSFAVVRHAQRAAQSICGSHADRVCATVDHLVRHQLSARGPLLRYRALNAVPQPARQQLLAVKERLVERFAGMIFDGIVDGSIRVVDPCVAAHLVDAMVNAAANLRRWVADARESDVSTLFARPLFDGLLTGPAYAGPQSLLPGTP
jgi:AcrR family transcriptional regulator